MHAWQEMEKRASILLRSKADLEKIVDGASWNLLASVKIDSLLESSSSARGSSRGIDRATAKDRNLAAATDGVCKSI
jgi:hypothetical protein